MKVLIVDDDMIVVESCRRILNAEGIETHVAGTVEEAEAVLDIEAFDAMITDIKMPTQDGFQLIAWAKTHKPEMIVLMMTGYLTPETQDKGLRSGTDAFIAKPFTPDELISTLYDTLKTRNHGG
ncbi:response regulator [Desulfosarcina sp.]|uniref:response regulator n=1 Tax=Desulfosarcina sp. TaxID=2027861 RepID=UPI003566B2B2